MRQDSEYYGVWRLARLNGYNLVISSDGFYSVCDRDFKTLTKCNTLKGASWYIKNMETLKFNQQS
jgi:hypothetical protein